MQTKPWATVIWPQVEVWAHTPEVYPGQADPSAAEKALMHTKLVQELEVEHPQARPAPQAPELVVQDAPSPRGAEHVPALQYAVRGPRLTSPPAQSVLKEQQLATPKAHSGWQVSVELMYLHVRLAAWEHWEAE